MPAILFWRLRRSLRLGSLSTSCFLVFVCAIFFAGAGYPAVVCAQSIVSGVTCTQVNGTYVCTQQGTGGVICVSGGGTQDCENLTTGGSGSTTSTSLGQGLGSTQQPPSGGGSSGWLSQLTHWYAQAIGIVFDAFVAFLKDLVTYCFAAVFSIVSAAISAIGTPGFMSNVSLQSIMGPAGGVLGYFLVSLNIPGGFGFIALAYVFRLTRKFLTLFQW
jgi:hypothetical protein